MPKCSSISIQAQARNRVESCSCNLFSNNSFSMVFPTATTHDRAFDEPITSSSPVDCTLSLSTPSTRHTSCNNGGDVKKPKSGNNNNSFMSNLCWSAFQTAKKTTLPSAPLPPTTVGCINNISISNGGDPLLARRCANCDTTSTPLWRNGPRGPKSLCNACGIRYKKEERRATTPQTDSGGVAAPQPPTHLMSHPAAWTHHHPGPSQKAVLGTEFRFMEAAAAAGETTNNFLSWRLNHPDHRASLVNDYTY